MKSRWVRGVMVGMMLVAPSVMAAEHGGQEHAGQEHGGATTAAAAAPAAASTPASAPAAAVAETTTPATTPAGAPEASAEPSAEQIRQTIRDYIAQIEEDEGAFTIEDETTGKTRTLTLERVHDRVGKTGDLYYSCTDMRDKDSGEALDLDYDVESYDGELEVVDTRIHKVNGQPRYTYDDKDNRIPVSP